MESRRDGAAAALAVERALAQADWARHRGERCALLGRAPVGLLPVVSATVRLDGRAGGAGLLLGVCVELGRRHGLDPLVRHTGVAATDTVRLRRRAGTPAGG